MIATRYIPVLLFLFAGSGLIPNAEAMAPRPADVTLLVVPERYSVIQVGFDVMHHRPTALVTYRGEPDTQDPVLHIWTDNQWMNISLDEYQRGDLFRIPPQRVILIGDTDIVPEILVTSSEWASQVMNIPHLESVALINSVGRTLDFDAREWRWFARRYNLQMEDTTPEHRRKSWYDQASFDDPEWLRRREAPAPEHRVIPPVEPREEPRMEPRVEPPPRRVAPRRLLEPEIRETRPDDSDIHPLVEPDEEFPVK